LERTYGLVWLCGRPGALPKCLTASRAFLGPLRRTYRRRAFTRSAYLVEGSFFLQWTVILQFKTGCIAHFYSSKTTYSWQHNVCSDTRKHYDPRQPTKGSLIELGLEYLSSLLDKSSCVQKLNSKAKEHKLVKKKQDTKGLTIKIVKWAQIQRKSTYHDNPQRVVS